MNLSGLCVKLSGLCVLVAGNTKIAEVFAENAGSFCGAVDTGKNDTRSLLVKMDLRVKP